MRPTYFELIIILLLFWIGGLLYQILRYMKLVWSKVFEIHQVAVPRENQAKDWIKKRHGEIESNEKE
jgi:hypothetical protein